MIIGYYTVSQTGKAPEAVRFWLISTQTKQSISPYDAVSFVEMKLKILRKEIEPSKSTKKCVNIVADNRSHRYGAVQDIWTLRQADRNVYRSKKKLAHKLPCIKHNTYP